MQQRAPCVIPALLWVYLRTRVLLPKPTGAPRTHRLLPAAEHLDLDHVLLGVQFPELQVLLVVIASTCGSTANTT
jgi:hypothetical protein